VEDDGRVNVASADGESAQEAISIIQELTATPGADKTYLGKVQRITDFVRSSRSCRALTASCTYPKIANLA